MDEPTIKTLVAMPNLRVLQLFVFNSKYNPDVQAPAGQPTAKTVTERLEQALPDCEVHLHFLRTLKQSKSPNSQLEVSEQ